MISPESAEARCGQMETGISNEGRLQARTEIIPREAPCSLILDEKLPERAGYFIIDNCVNPFDGKTWDIRVSRLRVAAIAKRGMGPAKEMAFILPMILRKPKAIFQGVREDGESEWLCYSGIPSCSYRGPSGDQRQAYTDEVFLVFVNADRVAYNHRWEACDPDNVNVPHATPDRFIRRVI